MDGLLQDGPLIEAQVEVESLHQTEFGRGHAVALEYLPRPHLVGDLHHDTRLLREQRGIQIGFLRAPLELDAPALVAGESHLQQGHDEPAVADVVAGHDGTAPDQVLHRLEDRLQSGGVLDIGSLVAQLGKHLRERAPSQTLLVAHAEQPQLVAARA